MSSFNKIIEVVWVVRQVEDRSSSEASIVPKKDILHEHTQSNLKTFELTLTITIDNRKSFPSCSVSVVDFIHHEDYGDVYDDTHGRHRSDDDRFFCHSGDDGDDDGGDGRARRGGAGGGSSASCQVRQEDDQPQPPASRHTHSFGFLFGRGRTLQLLPRWSMLLCVLPYSQWHW